MKAGPIVPPVTKRTDYTAEHKDEVLRKIAYCAENLRDHLKKGMRGDFHEMPMKEHDTFYATAVLIGALADSVVMEPVLGNAATWAIGDFVAPTEVPA